MNNKLNINVSDIKTHYNFNLIEQKKFKKPAAERRWNIKNSSYFRKTRFIHSRYKLAVCKQQGWKYNPRESKIKLIIDE